LDEGPRTTGDDGATGVADGTIAAVGDATNASTETGHDNIVDIATEDRVEVAEVLEEDV